MLNRGSEWRRGEPHIHASGTVKNDQFRGATAWDDYLAALKRAVIEAFKPDRAKGLEALI